MGNRTEPTLLLISRRAFYPVHAAVLRALTTTYEVSVAVLGAEEQDLPDVHRSLGWVTPVELRDWGIRVELLPPSGADWADDAAAIRNCLAGVDPDAVWVQEEPVDLIALEVLATYRRQRERPRIGCAVCENIFQRGDLRTRLRRRHLWPRLDVLLPVAQASLAGVRAVGMPRSIASAELVAGIDAPTDLLLRAPRSGGSDFRIGFVGRLVPEKGWADVLAALVELPGTSAAFAGDGPDRDALVAALAQPSLGGRAAWEGLLAKDDLWNFYRSLDCLVVPSRTTATWKEQFGAVIADAFAVGVPVVAFDSGAIAEVVGDSGIVVPEGDVEALTAALARVRDERHLREQLATAGRARYETEFSINAYAGKIAAAYGLRRRSSAGVA